MDTLYNMRSPAVRRLMKEAQELSIPTEDYYAQPVEDNLFEWHFTVRGPSESEFAGGLYHGRIILPPDYPMKPPSIILLNQNGRFDVNKKICLSISGHHPESWQPSWSIRTALLALIGFMPTHGGGAIGSLDYTTNERINLAKKSRTWICQICGPLDNVLREITTPGSGPTAASQEAKELASQISFKGVPQDVEPSSTSNSNEATEIPRLESSTGISEDEEISSMTNTSESASHMSFLEQDLTVSSQSPLMPLSTLLLWILSAAIAALLVRRFFFL